ncbi:hypothetical protein IW139_004065, partial [Coemansia sp. RSA 353]
INVGIGAMQNEQAARIPELDEAAMAPEPAEHEEPSMVELDEEHYADIANANVPEFYSFPSDFALLYNRLVKHQPTAEPTTKSAAMEHALFIELMAANVPRKYQRHIIDKLNAVMLHYEQGFKKMRHLEAVFEEHSQQLIQASAQYYY